MTRMLYWRIKSEWLRFGFFWISLMLQLTPPESGHRADKKVEIFACHGFIFFVFEFLPRVVSVNSVTETFRHWNDVA
jgi:succinate-acetate transporter protein